MPATRIPDFDVWRPGYGLALVKIYLAGTTTLADVFTNEELTAATDNQITLVERVIGGVSYGKFAVPLYVGVPYELEINSIDRTGVQRPPLVALDDEDASDALAIADGATIEFTIADHLARRVDVRDYGEWKAVGEVGASASTNNSTLVAAIGAASAAGGGYVELPGGTYQVTTYTLSAGVVLRGQGRGATVLQSTVAGTFATIGSTKAGFTRLTLDGVTLVGLSVGISAIGKDQIVMDDVEIKRFETGIYRKGGSACLWREVYISNCTNGAKLHGDSASGLGGALRFNEWHGGTIDTCSTIGIELKNVDGACEHNVFANVIFDTNTGTALKIVGARRTYLFDCNWTGNTTNLSIEDGSPLTATNSIIGLELVGGAMSAGALTFTGTYDGIAFRRMALDSISVTINAPGQNIPVEDCQVTNPTISGVPTCWMYRQSKDRGATLTITSDNSAHKAWALSLRSGQKVYLEGKVVGRQRNGVNTGFYHISVSAGRVGATLAYDTQTGNFTVGNVLTGGTSGATARITADSDSGSTGTLTLQDIVGTFVDNEVITDGAGGSALANGAISESSAALIGSVTAIRAAQETNANWNATFVGNGPQIELQVTGDTSQTVEWSVDVDVTTDQGSPIVTAGSNIYQIQYHGLSSGAFAVGMTIYGSFSGARGTIVEVNTTSATAGTLRMTAVSGAFSNNENISDSLSGGHFTVTAFAGP
ncbi:MAG: hypothetical protein IT537_03175 [Hyphomicrobiales bacterium]|nr:hypothetical protein [Hyphomicrobiales bacterium]